MTNLRQLAQDIGRLVDEYKRDYKVADISIGEITLSASAYVIAFQLPLPSERVDDCKRHFIESVSPLVESIASQLIEYLPINFNRLRELTEAIWECRYTMLHNPISRISLEAVGHSIASSRKLAPNVATSINLLVNHNLSSIVVELDGSLRAMMSENNQ